MNNKKRQYATKIEFNVTVLWEIIFERTFNNSLFGEDTRSQFAFLIFHTAAILFTVQLFFFSRSIRE